MDISPVLVAAALGGTGGSLVGALVTWLSQRQLSNLKQAWDLRLDVYSSYLEAVSLASLTGEEGLRAKRAMVLAKLKITVAGSIDVVQALEGLELVVARTPHWTDVPDGRAAFSTFVAAIRKDLGLTGTVTQANVERLLLGGARDQ
jgi:hypothetical protein